jgi:F-type H+-transporting ATPase subunit gamma
MASIKDLKKRIGTVKNTQQTTKAMKMVSAAKLRRAQDAITSQRPYARRLNELIQLVTALSGGEGGGESSLLKRDPGVEEGARKRLLLVVVTSDRGLCGAFNSGVIKRAARWAREHEDAYESIQLAYVGRKGHEFFRSRSFKQGAYFQELGGRVTFAKGKKLSDALIAAYAKGEVDEVKFVFNEFVNAVTQRVVVEDYLPPAVPAVKAAETAKGKTEVPAEASIYFLKPSGPELRQRLMDKNYAIQAFRILLESQAGEHGARMSAMENATKNAGEMIRKLSLQYNKQRQANITKELLEIISGSESQKGSS